MSLGWLVTKGKIVRWKKGVFGESNLQIVAMDMINQSSDYVHYIPTSSGFIFTQNMAGGIFQQYEQFSINGSDELET